MQDSRLYLWPAGRALIFGRTIDSTPHHHHALQLTLSLDTPFMLQQPGKTTQASRASLLWPGEPHSIASQGSALAHLFIDPGQRVLEAAPAPADADHGQLANELARCWRERWPSPQAAALARRWQERWLPGFDAAPSFDPRIAEAMHMLSVEQDEVDTPRLAQAVGLSTGRFIYLFRRHTGLPPRRYLIWRRLLIAVDAIASGQSLTEAAHDAGFADLPHMSRTFHATFGVVPSQLTRMEIVVDHTAP